jgi:hypothetical protein
MLLTDDKESGHYHNIDVARRHYARATREHHYCRRQALLCYTHAAAA